MPFRLAPDAANRTTGLCLERGWAVSILCETISCAHRADLGQAALAAYPPATPLEAIAARLKCSKCGNAEGLVGTRSGGGGPRTGAR